MNLAKFLGTPFLQNTSEVASLSLPSNLILKQILTRLS